MNLPIETIYKRYQQGERVRDLAREYNCSDKYLYQLFNKHIPTEKPSVTAEVKRKPHRPKFRASDEMEQWFATEGKRLETELYHALQYGSLKR